jgi:hypothetical protein
MALIAGFLNEIIVQFHPRWPVFGLKNDNLIIVYTVSFCDGSDSMLYTK